MKIKSVSELVDIRREYSYSASGRRSRATMNVCRILRRQIKRSERARMKRDLPELVEVG